MRKRISFSCPGMVARTMLSVLDNNFNIARQQATTNDGRQIWRFQWSKATKSFIVKKIYARKDYSFRDDLMEATVLGVENSKSVISINSNRI